METTPVPTEALNRLRRASIEGEERSIPGVRTSEVNAFLAAVDEVGEH